MDAFLDNNDAESLLLAARDNVRLNLTEFENEEEFWDNFVDKKSQKYKKFFKMDTKELYDYINSINE